MPPSSRHTGCSSIAHGAWTSRRVSCHSRERYRLHCRAASCRPRRIASSTRCPRSRIASVATNSVRRSGLDDQRRAILTLTYRRHSVCSLSLSLAMQGRHGAWAPRCCAWAARRQPRRNSGRQLQQPLPRLQHLPRRRQLLLIRRAHFSRTNDSRDGARLVLVRGA